MHLFSKHSLRSHTRQGNLLTDFLMFSKECIMSSWFGFWRRWVFSGPSLKKAACSLQVCSVCHSSLEACAYHDVNCMAREASFSYAFFFPILLVSLVSCTFFARSAPKRRSDRLVDSFAWEQSEWNLALRASVICSRRKRESSPTACPNRTMASLLAASVSLSLLGC